MAKRGSSERLVGPSAKKGTREYYDQMLDLAGDVNDREDERKMQVAMANLEGGGGGAGNMPPTSINNSFSGHVVIAIPDIMPAPVRLTYRDVWTSVKLQHPLVSELSDVISNTTDPLVQLTVTSVELYGASSGIISLAPWIQRSVPVLTITATSQVHYIGQQLIDVGTIDQKPFLKHTFGNGPENCRIVNYLPMDAANNAMDPLVTYQIVQKVATATVVDAGYLRVGFILKRGGNVGFLNIETIIPTPTGGTNGQSTLAYTYEEAAKEIEDTNEKTRIIRGIKQIKSSTLPTLDS